MKLLFALFVSMLLVGCGGAPQPTPIPIPLSATTKNIIVDMDGAADDLLAVLYLVSRPDLNVRAITITGTGVTRCAAGLRNLQALLETVKRTNIPIACGRETPLVGDHVFPTAWRDAAENFFGLNLRPAGPVTPTENAVELLTRTLDTSDTLVTILALGPFTNLAETFTQHPAVIEKIDMLYSMGGAVHVAGNVEPAPAAEWNFYCDPASVQQVFATNVPFTLVPLDVTNSVPVTHKSLARFTNQPQTPAAKLAASLLSSQRSDIDAGAIYFWDTLAAVILTDESFSPIREMPIEIKPTDAQTIETPNGKPVRVVTATDPARFEQIFLQILNGQFK